MFYKLYLQLLLILIVFGYVFGCTNAQSLSREVRELLLKTVVQIVPWNDATQDLADWSGSGTIISPEGYILTNYHVVGDLDSRQNLDWHAILMVQDNAVDQAPETTYWARYINGDPTYDLAILKIAEYPDESPVPEGTVFPALPVGDSNTLFPGDMITVIGYPGISGSTITFTRGIMSGWVGEDFESGGKQWIKTDAKIAGGNSGGTAVNSRGELIGVPTAGIASAESGLYEEQLYIRPISLAWALIGPNVPSVRRANSATASNSNTENNNSSSQPNNDQISSAGLPNGNYGNIELNSSRSNTIAPRVEDDFSYHTYVLEVPQGIGELTIAVTADGHDIDLAVKAGSEIASYTDEDGDFDFKDLGEEPNPSYTISSPQAGNYYIDVINLVDAAATYTLSVTSAETPVTQVPDIPSNQVPPTNNLPDSSLPDSSLPDIVANSISSGVIGNIAVGQSASGKLASLGGGEVSFHTYILDVPTGTRQIIVSLSADQDADLAAKFGSEITNYGDQIDGGDWNYRNTAGDFTTEMRILSPQAGKWYIDIFNALQDDVVAEYTITVTAQ